MKIALGGGDQHQVQMIVEDDIGADTQAELPLRLTQRGDQHLLEARRRQQGVMQ